MLFTLASLEFCYSLPGHQHEEPVLAPGSPPSSGTAGSEKRGGAHRNWGAFEASGA